MTQLHFNLNMEELKDSVMNSNMEAVVKSSMVLILNEYMKKERDAYLKVDHYERSEERQDQRNGYYDRH
ncbi:Transposase, Mutator family, partial [Gracilibacillus orientalis]